MSPIRPDPTERPHPERRGIPAPAAVALARVHPVALGLALGVLCGAWGFATTVWTIALGNPVLRRGLSLLSQYLPGYHVTAWGAALAFFYGVLAGFAAGYAFASTRNYLLAVYVRYLRRRAEREQLNEVLDRLI
jgi:hypothetical protein